MKRFYKSDDRVLSGVCGGLSEYMNPEIDPIFMRIAFAAVTIFNPLMIVLYLVLAIVAPRRNKVYQAH